MCWPAENSLEMMRGVCCCSSRPQIVFVWHHLPPSRSILSLSRPVFWFAKVVFAFQNVFKWEGWSNPIIRNTVLSAVYKLIHLQLNEIDMKNGGGLGGGEEVSSSSSSTEMLKSMNTSLLRAREQLQLQDLAMTSLNQSILHIGQNTTARLDWLDRDVAGLQVRRQPLLAHP